MESTACGLSVYSCSLSVTSALWPSILWLDPGSILVGAVLRVRRSQSPIISTSLSHLDLGVPGPQG